MLIRAAISFDSADHIITLSGRVAASEYGDFLGNVVYPVVQMFPENDSKFSM